MTTTSSPTNRLSGQISTPRRNGKNHPDDLLWLGVDALAKLQVHPLLKHIPEKADHDGDFASLIESVSAQGFLTPAIVDDAGNLLCGRHRRRVAVHLGRDLPCRQVSGERAAEVILNELCVARHLPKGALAYLVVPILEPALDAARERKLAALKLGPQARKDPFLNDSAKNALPFTEGLTVAEIAGHVGVSRRYFFQAIDLRKRLDALSDEQRADIEGKLLNGILDLGGAITAATNVKRNKESPSDLGKRNEHDRFFEVYGRKLGEHWEKATADQRQAALTRLAREAESWPPGMLAKVSQRLGSLARRVGKAGA